MQNVGRRGTRARTAAAAVLLTLMALSGCVAADQLSLAGNALQQPVLGSRYKPLLTVAGMHFRDLDADGALAPYEDWRLAPEQRVDDLLGRMTVAEKVGTMMHSTLPG